MIQFYKKNYNLELLFHKLENNSILLFNMSDVEPTVSYKPNNQMNEISINEINTTSLNIDSIKAKLEEQEMQDKVEPIKTS